MTKLLRRWMSILTVCTVGPVALAQEIEWKNYDPKKASRAEAEKVNRIIEQNLNRQLSRLKKGAGDPAEIRSLIMRGNKITTIVYNYGNITRPNTLGNVADLVWNYLGYGFEFTPLLAGEVIENGDTIRILDDGMWLPGQGGYSSDGTLKWGWLPKKGFAAPGQPDIAAWSHRADVKGDLTRKPHSWPEPWYNSSLGRYVWPAFLGNDASTPDEEVFFVVDDYTNAKYPYYPFPQDSTKRGLGLDMEVRFFQFNNPLAEDIIFLVYRVTNRSSKTINRAWFGMYGDPHVGGPSNYNDDLAFFIPPRGPLADPFPQRARSMVYAWDQDGKGDGGLKTGYFGFKFLESPTNSSDGIDNDDDGITDESPFNDAGFFIDGTTTPVTYGISDVEKYTARYGPPKPRWSGDEDGDWDAEKDDVGLDGIPGTGDLGEGNGKPDIGFDENGNLVSESNFGIRDVHESDQIGLTSFFALPYTNSLPNVPKNDILFFELLSTDSIRIDQQLFSTPSDNIFVYGSGPFTLGPGETQRFSVALLMGNDLSDLILNAETAQRVLEANYRFAQPPPKPNVTAVGGNGRVTLYWDNVAETAVDPLTGVNDFQGYKIYRSEDPTFSDVFTITDANGTPFLGKPYTQNGIPAQFDLKDQWSGLHPIEYVGRGVKYNLGSNTGLVHEYVDSNVVNGKTYYYAVASYDHGFDSLGVQLPPTESQISIIRDPITGQLQHDVNTVAVIPGPLPAGMSFASLDGNSVMRTKGIATGSVTTKILDHLAVRDNVTYNIDFVKKGSSVLYNVQPMTFEKEQFVSRDTIFVPLSRNNIITDSVTVRTSSGSIVDPNSYMVDGKVGRIRGKVGGALPKDQTFEVEYQYYAVFESNRLNSEDDNAAFDGMRVFVSDQPLGIDSLGSGWSKVNNTNLTARVHRTQAFSTAPFQPAPIDLQIIWNSTERDARGKWLTPGDTLFNNLLRKVVVTPFRIVNATNNAGIRAVVNNALTDSLWKPGREIAILTPTQYATRPNSIMLSVTFSPPQDTSTQVVYPIQGNIYDVKTTKPFSDEDQYSFTTHAAKVDNTAVKDQLNNIYVVPNPYVAFSDLELPGTSATRRGENRLQFRNLPTKCTIHIYTIVGELVDTIYKDDNNSYADWNLLTNEGHRLAYGVYIYHVEVPEVGEKIGRFAVIK